MKTIKEKHQDDTYIWFWSDKYWYCLKQGYKPVGSGDTKEEAFRDLQILLAQN